MPGAECVPTITITTPSFNQGEFIEETIVSVLSQQGCFAIEYIIMDGGSTDNSVEIIRKYDDMLRRGEWQLACKGITFRWTSGKDDGQGDAVNKGFARAQGEILGWLNSDDTYLTGAFQKAVECFQANPDAVMIYGNAYYTDKHSAVTDSYLSEAFSLERLAEYCFVCQPSVFLRASALKQVGSIDISLQTCMDYDLWIRIGKKFPTKILFVQDYLATSRMYEENKTLALREKVYQECMTTAYKHYGYVAYDWFRGYITDVVDGIYWKDKWRSLPDPIRMLIFLPAALPYLLRSGHVKSLSKALSILNRFLTEWLYVTYYLPHFPGRAATLEKNKQ